MIKFIKSYLPGFLNLIMMIASFIALIMYKPAGIVIAENGWLVVRTVALIWALFMGIGTYCKWYHWGKGISAFYNGLITGNQPKTPWGHSLFRKASMVGWVIIWVVVAEIIAIFYIAEYCPDGF